jgi:ribosome biogenesis GTPase / thiamine phosphate phosphatase
MQVLRGRVVRSTGSFYTIAGSDGVHIECRLKGKFRIKGIKTTNPVAVGDWVEYEIDSSGNGGMITGIEQRNNYIIRRSTNLSKVSHILASNLDQAILVATLAMPRTSSGFIDRFLVTCEAYRIPAIVVFNKTDLYKGDLNDDYLSLKSVYQEVGYRCLGVSALTGHNTSEFRDLLHNKTTLISGHSGVGKSALINAIEPSLNLKTGIISEYHNKGKHTTTFAEMLSLSFGGYIIDTPGIKEFGLLDFQRDELTHFFPEFFRLLPECQFYNCTHEHEPGCAVKQALGRGELSTIRYQNYLNMLNGRDMAINPWETE